MTHRADDDDNLVAFLLGADVTNMGWHLAAVGAFALLLPIGLIAVAASIEVARRRGALAQY